MIERDPNRQTAWWRKLFIFASGLIGLMSKGFLCQPKNRPFLPVTTLFNHQPSQIAIIPELMNRHTPKNSNNVEIDEALPKAAKIRIAPKKTATKNQKKANIE
jgi:hypothetical protein